MKTKTIKLYEYSELKKEAQEKAYKNWRHDDAFDEYGLQVELDNLVGELLEKNKITPVSTADRKYPSKYANVYASLSYCQGDGAMFEGTFTWRKWTVNIKQSGHYYHSNSKTIDITKNDEEEYASAKIYAQFEAIYQSICKELEKHGYAYIEDMQSEAYFVEECNANEWTFRENGIMENE